MSTSGLWLRVAVIIGGLGLVVAVLLLAAAPPSGAEAPSLATGPIRAAQPLPYVPFVSEPVNAGRFLFRNVAAGLSQPLYVTHAGDGSGRLFVVEKTGRIRILKAGSLLTTPFLDISSGLDLATSSEQGLLGLAFHPDYETNGQFYIAYTYNPAGGGNDFRIRLARYLVSADPDVADADSGSSMLEIDHPTTATHNGGTLVFGPDGFLYWTVGDGGVNSWNAQDLNSLLGKVLRLDVDNPPTFLPPHNPFIELPDDDPDTRGEIWAYGLRNPFRAGFDVLTGDFYIGDVGHDKWDEIDYQPAGRGGVNYGWPAREGNACYMPALNCADPSNYVAPIAEYQNPPDSLAAIIGGSVYRGLNFPSLLGWYFYGELYTHEFFGLRNDPAGWISLGPILTPYSMAGIGADERGELYLADLVGGAVYQLRYRERLQTPGDFDGDSAADPVKFIPDTGKVWWLESSTSAWVSADLGSDVTMYVPRSDFDGDGRTDPAKYVSSGKALWYLKSGNGEWHGEHLGPGAYSLLPGSDFDGDGATDPTKYVPAGGAVWYLSSATGDWNGLFIGSDAAPALAGSDYDGDGRTDAAKYVPSTGAIWFRASSTSTWHGIFIGADGMPIPASDFDGDRTTDAAKLLPDNTLWYRASSTGSWNGIYLGPGKLAYVTASDFDGDGKTDPAVFDTRTHGLYYLESSAGTWASLYLGAETFAVAN